MCSRYEYTKLCCSRSPNVQSRPPTTVEECPSAWGDKRISWGIQNSEKHTKGEGKEPSWFNQLTARWGFWSRLSYCLMRSQEYGQHMMRVMQNEYVCTIDVKFTGFPVSSGHRSLSTPTWKRVQGTVKEWGQGKWSNADQYSLFINRSHFELSWSHCHALSAHHTIWFAEQYTTVVLVRPFHVDQNGYSADGWAVSSRHYNERQATRTLERTVSLFGGCWH